MMFSESAGTGRPSYPNYAPLGDREGEAPAEPHGARICWGDGSPGGSPSQFFHPSPFKGGIKFSSLVSPPSARWSIIVKSKAPKSKRFFKTGLSKPLKRLLPKKQRP